MLVHPLEGSVLATSSTLASFSLKQYLAQAQWIFAREHTGANNHNLSLISKAESRKICNAILLTFAERSYPFSDSSSEKN